MLRVPTATGQWCRMQNAGLPVLEACDTRIRTDMSQLNTANPYATSLENPGWP